MVPSTSMKGTTMMVNSPKLWDKLLAAAPKGSALMGGAIIDYLLGIVPHDFDIFYTYKPGMQHIFPGNWVQTAVNFNDPVWIKEHAEMYLQGIDEHGNPPISSVTEYMVDDEHKVQMVGVHYDDPLKHFQNFDHSLTLATYNNRGMFVHKKVFQSKENHTITYVSKNKEIGAVNKSLIRAQAKIARLPLDGHGWELKGFVPVIKPKPLFKWHDINLADDFN